jgi:anti-anti-sigma factor
MVNGVPVMVAPQEIDAHNADFLRAVLLQAAARGHATFVVDMTGTQFCASAGLSVLVRAHKRALADGGELRRCAWRPSARGSPRPNRPGPSARRGPGRTARPGRR